MSNAADDADPDLAEPVKLLCQDHEDQTQAAAGKAVDHAGGIAESKAHKNNPYEGNRHRSFDPHSVKSNNGYQIGKPQLDSRYGK